MRLGWPGPERWLGEDVLLALLNRGVLGVLRRRRGQTEEDRQKWRRKKWRRRKRNRRKRRKEEDDTEQRKKAETKRGFFDGWVFVVMIVSVSRCPGPGVTFDVFSGAGHKVGTSSGPPVHGYISVGNVSSVEILDVQTSAASRTVLGT